MSGLVSKICITFGCITILIGGFQIYDFLKTEQETEATDRKILETAGIIEKHEKKENEDEPEKQQDEQNVSYEITREGFDSLKAQYPLTVAYIAYDDGFIAEPIGKAGDNEYLLRRDLNGNYSEKGTVFMDAGCDSDSQNITLYGHNVYYDPSSRFSPLSQLMTQNGYDIHNTFRIWYGDRVATYAISYVVRFSRNQESISYSANEYTDETDYQWKINWLEQRQLIIPVSEARHISYTDRTVTLQTCVKWHPDQLELVVAREILSELY